MKKALTLLLTLGLAFSLTACGDDYDDYEDYDLQESKQDVSTTTPSASDSDWVFYWYVCGSDLESDDGSATTDIEEMMDVELPDNVTVVLQTGGASAWQNDWTDENSLQRWVYDASGELSLVDQQDSASMGDADTLADFLSFAYENYPADKIGVIFWNHGGGSVSGVSFDELYDDDSLTLHEIQSAFAEVWDASSDDQPLEMVGFDTCLMATIDTAAVLKDYAHYMVASEETEPGTGWDYTGWLSALAEKPGMDGAELGQYICTTYYDSLDSFFADNGASTATLSVTDLGKVDALIEAYEAFGQEAIQDASSDASFYTDLSKAAKQTENYGGNTRSEGYTNMMDLGHFARQTAWLLPSAQGVLDALDDCIIYKVNGDYRAESTGLSCYYSYNGDLDDLDGFMSEGAGSAFKYLYYYQLTGEWPTEEQLASTESVTEYLDTIDVDVDDMTSPASIEDVDWDGIEIEIDDDGYATLDLGPEASEILADISFHLYYMNEEEDFLLDMGSDNDIDCDWDAGIFKDNFRGVWGSLDEIPVYMELSDSTDDYNLYTVPILLNDEDYNLHVTYNFNTEEWTVLGASKGLDDHGMASKEMRQLKEGDEISIIYYESSISDEDAEFESYVYDTIVYSEDTVFEETDLYIGTYAFCFHMTDAAYNETYSDFVYFEMDENGEIYTY